MEGFYLSVYLTINHGNGKWSFLALKTYCLVIFHLFHRSPWLQIQIHIDEIQLEKIFGIPSCEFQYETYANFLIATNA